MQAVAHMALGLAFVVAAGGWGWALWSCAGRVPASDPDRLIAYPLAGLCVLALLGSVLWVTGGFTPTLAWTLTLTGLGLALWGAHSEGTVRTMEQFRAASDAGTRRWSIALWSAATVLALPVLLAPDTSWESSARHLVAARDAARSGALPMLADTPWMANPLSTHTWLGWGYLLTGVHRDVSGRVILTLAAALSLALATRRLGRRVHPRAGLVALVLIVAHPLWLARWGTAQVEPAIFALACAALALLVLSREEQRWRVLALAALVVVGTSGSVGIPRAPLGLSHMLPWQWIAALLVAVVWARWCARPRPLAWTLRAALVAAWIPLVVPVAEQGLARLPVITGRETSLVHWLHSDPATPVIRVANDLVAADDRLFVAGPRVIQLSMRRDQVVYGSGGDQLGLDSEAALRSAWNRWGIDYVLICTGIEERGGPLRQAWFRAGGPALRDWKLIAEHAGARLYERSFPVHRNPPARPL